MAPTTAAGPFGLLAAGLLTTAALAENVGPRASLPSGYAAAPYYPSPYTGWVADWSESVQKAKALVDTMTLAEKANITAGTGIFMGKSLFPCPSLAALLTTFQSKSSASDQKKW